MHLKTWIYAWTKQSWIISNIFLTKKHKYIILMKYLPLLTKHEQTRQETDFSLNCGKIINNSFYIYHIEKTKHLDQHLGRSPQGNHPSWTEGRTALFYGHLMIRWHCQTRWQTLNHSPWNLPKIQIS